MLPVGRLPLLHIVGFSGHRRLADEAGARDAGKLRLEGKEYVVREGDVMHFRFNV